MPDSPEISDEELATVDACNVRMQIECLLRLKRVPPAYAKLLAIAELVRDRLADANRVANLEQHITKSERVKAWQSLAATVSDQIAWHRGQVNVSRDEVNELVTRWLLLQFPV